MTVVDFRAFRELRDGYHEAADAADARGDAAYARGCREAAVGLLDQVPPKLDLIPDTFDGLLERRAQADAIAVRAAYRTKHPYALVSRQADFARRLDAIITGKDKA